MENIKKTGRNIQKLDWPKPLSRLFAAVQILAGILLLFMTIAQCANMPDNVSAPQWPTAGWHCNFPELGRPLPPPCEPNQLRDVYYFEVPGNQRPDVYLLGKIIPETIGKNSSSAGSQITGRLRGKVRGIGIYGCRPVKNGRVCTAYGRFRGGRQKWKMLQ